MLTTVLLDILGPILVMVAVGALLRRSFAIDMATLSKLNIYVFVPAFIFHHVSTSTMPGDEMLAIVALSIAQVIALGVVTSLICLAARVPAKTLAPILLAVLFYNSGNVGLPLAQLAFRNEGAAAQTFVLLTQNVLTFTVGLSIAGWIGTGRIGHSFLTILRLPVIPTLVAALTARWWITRTGHPLPHIIADSASYLAGGLVPIALVTLGAQLGGKPRLPRWRPVSLALFLRLAVAPVVMIGLLALARYYFPAATPTGISASLLVLTAGTPTAVNTLLLTLETGGDPDLAADCVFWSTLFSALTLTAWLLFLTPAPATPF
jgi:predicted permease